MGRVSILMLIFGLSFAPAVHAGAWLREKGTAFTSVSFTANYFRDIGNSAYLEYGLRENLTFGADIGNFTNRFGSNSGFATFFIRRPLGANDGPNRWAYELGIGTGWIGEALVPHIKTSLVWGRGITLKEKSGWMGVDASVTWDLQYGLHLTKVDSTIGLNFTDQTTGMLQLYLSSLDGENFATLAPSFVFKPKKGKFKYQVGIESPFERIEDTSIKLGLWREF